MVVSAKTKKGFTLIELLVVVAIISLLSSIIIGSVQDAREKAAVAKLKEDARQFANAMEIYRNSNTEYPQETDATARIMNNMASNYLEDYISDFNISMDGITSFGLSSGANFMYYSGTLRTGCGNSYSDYEYVLYFSSPDDVSDLFDNLYNDGTLQSGVYCLIHTAKN